jgi:hypothetical protein
MKYAWFIIAVMSARFLVTAVGFPPADGDLAWQRWLGRTIVATHRIPRALGNEAFSAVGASWTPQEWLFAVAAAWGEQSSRWKIFAATVALCATATLALIAYRAARRGAEPIDVAMATGAAGTALYDSFGVRAQVVAWPMLALFTVLLDNEGPWIWAAVPVAALWSNLHASAMLAPLLAGAVWIGRLLEDRAWTPRVGRIAGVTAASGVAICCNPFGVGLPLYAISLFHSPIKAYISEWKTTDVGEYAFSLGALPLLLGIVILGAGLRSRRAARAEDMLIFAACAFLLFFAVRNVPIFAIIAAPLFARMLTQAWMRPSQDAPATNLDRIAGVALPALTVLLAILVGYKLLGSTERAEITMPFREVDMLEKMPGEHRIMCADFAWCSYFIGKPGQRVFLDGRADPYPPDVWREFALVAYLRPGWNGVLDRYRVDAVIVKRETPVDQALALTHQWKEMTHDAKFRLWTRTL